MTRYRLTRRGRLLLQTFPVFLVLATGVSAVSNRLGGGERTARAVEESPSPAPTASPTPTVSPAAARPRPSRTPSPAPRPTTPPPRVTTPAYAGTGMLVTAPGSSGVHGSGSLRRFTVEVEQGLSVTPAQFARSVERVLFDRRSWRAGGLSFQRVASGPVAFRVVLASPATTDRLCRPLRTGGIFSCYMNGRAVLNAMRWQQGASSYAGDLVSYRVYMVNHEVGHALGHGHRYACGSGGLAPVMVQQTKGLRGCGRNPWPLPEEF